MKNKGKKKRRSKIDNKIRLYHYTSLFNLTFIMKEGISIGDVPTTPVDGFNAVWLTKDPLAGRQKWAATGFLADSQKQLFDKTLVRITVELEKNDPMLMRWNRFAVQVGVSKQWRKMLEKAGGDASTWHLYLGVIHPDNFIHIERPDVDMNEIQSIVDNYEVVENRFGNVTQRGYRLKKSA